MISIALTKIATVKPMAYYFRANATKITQILERVKNRKKSNADVSNKSTLIRELFRELWKMLRCLARNIETPRLGTVKKC